jgi:hypothetical protein
MPTVALILAVCLYANPDTCREEHLYFESNGSLRACMSEALPTMAQWAGTHPEWHIERFRCEWAHPEEKKT